MNGEGGVRDSGERGSFLALFGRFRGNFMP